LAEFQGLSETFLSKVFGKLSKAVIVSSVSGVKGGYRLSKSPEDISFWDVVEAVEGPKPIFQCKNIKDMVFCIEKAAVQLPPFAPSI
jgi:Rrf2 family protein